jgi:hypothetical protein
MYSSPVCANLSTNSILVATGIACLSFCNPSLGPTSTMRTWSARLDAAAANVLRWHGWRAARRAARRHVNFEDMAKSILALCWSEGRRLRVYEVLLWRAVCCGEGCGDRGSLIACARTIVNPQHPHQATSSSSIPSQALPWLSVDFRNTPRATAP